MAKSEPDPQDENKRKFREALERKKANAAGASARAARAAASTGTESSGWIGPFLGVCGRLSRLGPWRVCN